MNGASRIIYASKPDTPVFRNVSIRQASPPKGTTVGFRQDIAASSSSGREIPEVGVKDK